MLFDDLNKKTEDYVLALFKQNPDGRLFYHNLMHTREVVSRIEEIAKFYTPAEEIMFQLQTAAWFHDTGYLFVGSTGHEEEGIRIMTNFLVKLKVSPILIDNIGKCILATKRAVKPVSLPEKILCDADTYHFGTLLFQETNILVKKEVEALSGTTLKHWIKDSLSLLDNHRFYTSYCRQKLDAGKQLNIEWLHSQE